LCECKYISGTGLRKFLTKKMYFKTIYSRRVRVEFLMEKLAPRLVFLQVLWLSLLASFHKCFILIHSSIINVEYSWQLTLFKSHLKY
jgi:hypothetical protein